MTTPAHRPSASRWTTLKGWLLLRLLRRAAPPDDAPARPRPPRERDLPASPRAELIVALLLLAGALGAAGFVVLYVVEPDTQLLGLSIGAGLLLLGVAIALAGKRVVPQEQHAEPYHDFGDEQATGEVAALVREGRDGVSRRGLLAAAAGTAGAAVGAAALVPLASIGPSVGDRVASTPWRAGRRVVDSAGRPLRPEEIPTGTLIPAFPEGAPRNTIGSPVNLLRFEPEELELPAERRAAAPGGVIAYSRICTHAACAVSLYRSPLYPPNSPGDALVCPCHYSTFDPRRGGAVTFGPAGRPLPQLPLAVNGDGELVAAGDFLDAVGPSFGGIRQIEPEDGDA